MITLTQLQTEVSEWSHRNFPGNKPHHPLLGLCEEHGELHDAKTTEETADAIADVIIYLADYCGRNGLQLRAGRVIGNALRWLCHYHLKGEQGIRHTPEEIQAKKQEYVEMIVANMIEGSRFAHLDFYKIVDDTWESVKQRDWQKNPLNAASVAQ